MKLTRMMVVVAVLLGTAMCGFAGELGLIGQGSWVSSTTPPNQVWTEDISVWMDIKVPNWSYQKTVGVIWTADGWKTWKFSYAKYEYTRGDGYEQWGVDIVPAGVLGNSYIGPAAWNGQSLLGGGKAEVEYAIFYTLPNGYTLWDNNGGWNFHILIASRG